MAFIYSKTDLVEVSGGIWHLQAEMLKATMLKCVNTKQQLKVSVIEIKAYFCECIPFVVFMKRNHDKWMGNVAQGGTAAMIF